MKISVLIPTIGKENVNKILNCYKEADEIIIVKNDKQQVVDNINDGVKKTKGDIIVWVNDRCTVRKGWRKEIEDAFSIIKSGVVSFFPIYVTNGAISRDYIEKYQNGYLLWPEYIHHWADLELAEKAKGYGKYKEIEGIAQCFPKTPKRFDKRKFLRQVQWDCKTYWRRKNLNFPTKFTVDMEKRSKYIYIS